MASAPGEMSLFEHLAELRQRLVRAILGLLAGTIVGFAVYEPVLEFLMRPYCDIPAVYRAVGPDNTPTCALVALRPLEPFAVRMKIALLVGVFVGGPIIFYQLWRFVTPGLTPRERRYSLPFVIGSQLMFVIGAGFSLLVMARGLEVLLKFGGGFVQPQISAEAYIGFVVTMILAFGLTFEVPLLITFLSLAGAVTRRTLKRIRPYAIVTNFVIAAVITPTGDPFTLFALALPMVAFYEASILAAWFIERSRARRQNA